MGSKGWLAAGIAAVSAAAITVAATLAWPDSSVGPNPDAVPAAVGSDDVPVATSDGAVLVSVGDIACDPEAPAYNDGVGTPAGCRQAAVGDVVRTAQPDVFVPLGDMQYEDGSYEKFMASYDVAFGDLKSITKPIPGNHEYKTARAAGYYEYFGEAAHPESDGTYSFDVGDWHVLAINSMTCTEDDPCGAGSEMAEWIAADVAAHPSQCMMAVWHHPVWSVGGHSGYAPMVPVWNQLNSYGVDLVMNGHDHMYERFRPLGEAELTDDGEVADPVVTPEGMVQFVLGTGGVNNYYSQADESPGVEAALAAMATDPEQGVFGALRLTLEPESYTFTFMPADGVTFTDSGSAGCRAKSVPN